MLRDDIGYQNRAVEDMMTISERYLSSTLTNPKYLTLKAITGSGKTVIASKYIVEMTNEYNDLAFVWISVGSGNLHLQSKSKLDEYLPVDFTTMEDKEALLKNSLTAKDVLFLNWESINTTKTNPITGERYFDNIVMRDGEKRNLQMVWENTRNLGTKIILIIDESHHTAGSETSQLIIKLIQPAFIVELTATPNYSQRNPEGHYLETSVDVEEVIREGVIKKSIRLNDIDSDTATDSSIIAFMMNQAIDKREELKAAYLDLGIDYINPLCLIQIPNAVEGEELKDEVISILAERGYSISNGGVAIWLYEGSINKDEIEAKDSPVSFLIFKQAIAMGWDCPRASILVKLRDIQSEIFDLQTIGRILRTPELKHYEENDVLNHSYIYTNADYTLKTGGYPNVLPQRQTLKSEFRDDVLSLSFTSEKVSWIPGEKTDREIEEFVSSKLDTEQLNLNTADLAKTIKTSNVKTEKFARQAGQEIKTEASIETKYELRDNDVDRLYNKLIKSLKSNTYTVGRLNRVLLRYLKCRYTEFSFTELKAVALLNEILITQTINSLKKQDKLDAEYKVSKNENFIFPTDRYSKNRVETDYTKCAYIKHFKPAQAPENAFENYMEGLENIEYWIKNGDSGEEALSIAYKEIDSEGRETGALREFYPDYVIKFNDGTVGIFEVKSRPDRDRLITNEKIKALETYTKEHSFIGGLVEVEDGQVYIPTLHIKLK